MKIIIFLCMSCSLLFSQGSIQTPLGIYNLTPPILVNNSFSPFQLDQNGSLKVTVANLTIPWGSLTGNIGDQADLINMFGLYLRCPDTACLWSNSTNYQIRDVAYDGNEFYLALLAGSNHQPSISPTYWKLIGGGANVNGYYLVNQATNAPTNAVNLGVLATGLMKLTVSGSVATPSTAIAGTDYMRPGQVYDNLVTVNNAASPYTVAATASYILCDATAGAVVINLPAATGTGREIAVKKTDSSSNACTPTRAGSDTIDGATSYSLTTQYASSKVVDAASAAWHRSHVNQVGGALGGISTNATISGISSTQYMLPVSSSTAGQLGTSTTLLNGGIFYPSSDSTTAIKFNKADGATNVVTVDTTNARLGIGSSSPGATLDVAKTSTYTARFYDQTATTGTTRVVLRAGAGDADGDKLFEQFLNDGTTSKFSITRGGTVTSVLFTGTDFSNANNRWRLDGTSSSAYGLALAADSRIMFSQSNGAYYDTKDAGISRNAAGVIEINSGTTGRFADIKVRHLRTGTVATYAPAPTISSGFGTTPSIAGSDSAGRVTIGNPTGTSGVITFGTAWTTAPACTANDEVTGVTITTAATTTQLTLAGAFVAADTVVFHCIGY